MSAHVLIVPAYGWHDTILRPLESRLRDWLDVDYVSADEITAGWQPLREPDLIVVCDAGTVARLRESFPQARFMHIGHGLISKNETATHYGEPDYICVASNAIVERLTARGHTPKRRFYATGLIQTDPLFSRDPAVERTRVAGCRTSILYAPTWTPSLTSAAMFGADLIGLLRGEDVSIGVVIKPHPHIAVARPDWIEMWARMAQNDTSVLLCDPDSDLMPAILGADLLVSDASSAIFHYLALDRPMVLVDNPDRFSLPRHFDPEGIEWLWRDVADSTETVTEVRGLVEAGLRHPDRRSAARKSRRDQLFGDLTDGRSCERVSNAIAEVLRDSGQS